MLVDLRSIGMTGKVADQLVSGVNITANKNTVPFDPESPFVTSGLRLGSPAMTTRGMGTAEFTEIANIIADRLLNPEDEAVAQDCRQRIASLCERFPLYPHLGTPVPALV
jgi:glycine hydroxymethyltransferase